ncbi:hypothetical protein [Clostridium sardiniense]|uniref:hypothetical protein n=1 Tax=Clostridium sardiniense TaxID=29369 RepID=UPI001959ECF8|nr:hypothetical protein [Clostridium sardiniense]MBM7836496.1 putative Holliday junction resolvase-like endonuclease [Clostridium sardiniense]
MDIIESFGKILFIVGGIVGLCNIVLFLILIICIPMINSRIKSNTESIEYNTERIENTLRNINKNLIRLGRDINKNNKREMVDIDNEETIKEESHSY